MGMKEKQNREIFAEIAQRHEQKWLWPKFIFGGIF